ncbi:hypothetical protein OAK93_01380, partial [bacterium]|nr:hypothetical protein [bacterium]
MKKSLKERLNSKVPMLLAGFESLYHNQTPLSPKSVEQLQFDCSCYQDNYDLFKEKILSSMKKTYLPVYRMADGEFLFIKCMLREKMGCLKKIDRILLNLRQVLRKQKMYGRDMPNIKKEQLGSVFDPYYFRVAHNESYTKNELKLAKDRYSKDLKMISKNGYLGMHFVKYHTTKTDFGKNSKAYQEQLDCAMKWFDDENILVDKNNYTSFYYIYALLTGPDRFEIFT